MSDFLSAFGGGATSSLLNLFGGALNYYYTNSLMDKNNAYNEKMYQQYMSPQAQMQQMNAAGVSPAAAAAGISGAPGSASVLGSSVPSFNSSSSLGSDAVAAALGFSNLKNEQNRTDIQLSLTNQNIKESSARIVKLNKEGKIDDKTYQWIDRLNNSLLKTDEANREKISADIGVLNKQKEQITAVIAQILKQNELTDSQIDLTNKQVELSDAEIQFKKTEQGKIVAEIGFIDKQKHFLSLQELLLQSEIANTDADTVLKESNAAKLNVETSLASSELELSEFNKVIKQYESNLSAFYDHYLQISGKPYDTTRKGTLFGCDFVGFVEALSQYLNTTFPLPSWSPFKSW